MTVQLSLSLEAPTQPIPIPEAISPSSPVDDLRFFAAIDQDFCESGRSGPWHTQVYPLSGIWRAVSRNPLAPSGVEEVYINLRLETPESLRAKAERVPSFRPRIEAALTVGEGHMVGQGYPEVREVLDQARQQQPVAATELQPGQTYLYEQAVIDADGQQVTEQLLAFVAADTKLAATGTWEQPTDNPSHPASETKTHVVVSFDTTSEQADLLGYDKVIAIDPTTFEPSRRHKPGLSTDIGLVPITPQASHRIQQCFYPLSDEARNTLVGCRTPILDPLLGTGISRETATFCAAVSVLQIELQRNTQRNDIAHHATLDQQALEAALKDVERQAMKEKEDRLPNFIQGLRTLVERFGQEEAYDQLRYVLQGQLNNAKQTAAGVASCAVPPIEYDFRHAVREIFGSKSSFEDIGHAERLTSQHAYRAEVTPLWGEKAFWLTMAENFPSLFCGLVTAANSSITAKNKQQISTLLKCIRYYFPDTHDAIRTSWLSIQEANTSPR